MEFQVGESSQTTAPKYKPDQIQLEASGLLHVGNDYYEIQLFVGGTRIDQTRLKGHLKELFEHTKGVFEGVDFEFDNLDNTQIQKEGIKILDRTISLIGKEKSVHHYGEIEKISQKILNTSSLQTSEDRLQPLEEAIHLWESVNDGLNGTQQVIAGLNEHCPNLHVETKYLSHNKESWSHPSIKRPQEFRSALEEYKQQPPTNQESQKFLDMHLDQAKSDIQQINDRVREITYPNRGIIQLYEVTLRDKIAKLPKDGIGNQTSFLEEYKSIKDTLLADDIIDLLNPAEKFKPLNEFEGKLQKAIHLQSLESNLSLEMKRAYPDKKNWTTPYSIERTIKDEINIKFVGDDKIWNKQLQKEITLYDAGLENLIKSFQEIEPVGYSILLDKLKNQACKYIDEEYFYLEDTYRGIFKNIVTEQIDFGLGNGLSGDAFEVEGMTEKLKLFENYSENLSRKIQSSYSTFVTEALQSTHQSLVDDLSKLQVEDLPQNKPYLLAIECVKLELASEAEDIQRSINLGQLQGQEMWKKILAHGIAPEALSKKVDEYLRFFEPYLVFVEQQINQDYSHLPQEVQKGLLLSSLNKIAKNHYESESNAVLALKNSFQEVLETQLSIPLKNLNTKSYEKNLAAFEQLKWKMEEQIAEVKNLYNKEGTSPEKAYDHVLNLQTTWSEEKISQELETLNEIEKKKEAAANSPQSIGLNEIRVPVTGFELTMEELLFTSHVDVIIEKTNEEDLRIAEEFKDAMNVLNGLKSTKSQERELFEVPGKTDEEIMSEALKELKTTKPLIVALDKPSEDDLEIQENFFKTAESMIEAFNQFITKAIDITGNKK